MLSDNIRTIRKNRGFTQEELAARLHVTRQTISKWEKGYSVPDAELLSRMAEILEVPVTELLGAPSSEAADPEPIVEQLSRLNEQLAVRNRRAARIWRTVGIALAVIVVLYIALAAAGAILFRGETVAPAGSVTWKAELDGETSFFGLEYTENYRVTAVSSNVSVTESFNISEYSDARTAQDALYGWYEGRGGTVELVRQSGLQLPEPVRN